MMHDLKVLRYDSCVTRGSHSFTCHPHTSLYSPATRHHRPLAITNLYCLVTEAHRCERLAQSFYTACPAEIRTHDLLIASLTLYRQSHYAASKLSSTVKLGPSSDGLAGPDFSEMAMGRAEKMARVDL